MVQAVRERTQQGLPSVPYMLQTGGSYCFLLSILNAKRYYGLQTCEQGDPEFEELLDFSFARSGPCLRKGELCERLGVELTEVPMEEVHLNFPVEFGCWPPGSRSHSVLAVGGDAEEWGLVNYRVGTGPVVEWVKVADLEVPPEGVQMHKFQKVTIVQR